MAQQQNGTDRQPDHDRKKAPEPEKGVPEHRSGKQLDDNLDDLGRNVNDPGDKQDQPTTRKSH